MCWKPIREWKAWEEREREKERECVWRKEWKSKVGERKKNTIHTARICNTRLHLQFQFGFCNAIFSNLIPIPIL